jgi:uncharacterized protein (TIGR04255 family)
MFMGETETQAILRPLLEAIFELRWKLPQPDPTEPPQVDRNYKLAVGALFAKLQDEYQEHKQLPLSALPDEISAYVVQHQFKTKGVGWPLVQVGQGILTVNDVYGYKWETFKPRLNRATEALLKTYAELGGTLEVSTLALRYINAMDFNFEGDNILSFLKANMGLTVELSEKLTSGFGGENPNAIDLNLQFQASVPEKSDVKMRFFRGQRNDGSSGLMWETLVRARPDSVQNDAASITDWAEKAHKVTRALFDALTANVQKVKEGD